MLLDEVDRVRLTASTSVHLERGAELAGWECISLPEPVDTLGIRPHFSPHPDERAVRGEGHRRRSGDTEYDRAGRRVPDGHTLPHRAPLLYVLWVDERNYVLIADLDDMLRPAAEERFEKSQERRGIGRSFAAPVLSRSAQGEIRGELGPGDRDRFRFLGSETFARTFSSLCLRPRRFQCDLFAGLSEVLARNKRLIAARLQDDARSISTLLAGSGTATCTVMPIQLPCASQARK